MVSSDICHIHKVNSIAISYYVGLTVFHFLSAENIRISIVVPIVLLAASHYLGFSTIVCMT